MLIFLWYLGHQTSSFRDVADRFDVTVTSLHRIIRRVSVFLSNLSPQIITWPDENEKKIIEEHFLNNGFPNVIGAIDMLHMVHILKETNPKEMRSHILIGKDIILCRLVYITGISWHYSTYVSYLYFRCKLCVTTIEKLEMW